MQRSDSSKTLAAPETAHTGTAAAFPPSPSVAVAPDPAQAATPSSVAAIERLRARLEVAAGAGARQLPPERRLAADLAVSRAALRRALEVLEAEGQIWRVQGKGTFLGARPAVTSGLDDLPGRVNPMEMMEVRLEIEPTLARLAAQRASADDVVLLHRLAERAASASDAEGRELWDGALHHRIAEAAGNRLFVRLFELIDKVRQDARFQSLRERARTQPGQAALPAQHERIIERIAARDGAGAEAAMREHLETVAHRLATAMGGRGLSFTPPPAAGDRADD